MCIAWEVIIVSKRVNGCSYVTPQNLPWYKTGFESRQVLHLLSKLQNWICPKTVQYKTCMVSNTKIEASIGATKPKPWQSQLTSEIVEIFIQNVKGRFSADAKPVLVRHVERRHNAGFGAVGLGMAQSGFRSRHKADFRAVGLGSALRWFWSRHKASFGAVDLGSAKSRFWSRHKAGFGAAGYKTGFVSRQVLHLLLKLQNWICPKTGQYKTCIVSNTKFEACTRATKPKPWQSQQV